MKGKGSPEVGRAVARSFGQGGNLMWKWSESDSHMQGSFRRLGLG
jgi:hypothetical protein